MPESPQPAESDLHSLVQRMEQLRKDFHQQLVEPRQYWQLHYGPVRIRRRLSSRTVTSTFLSFWLLTLAAGLAAIFFDSTQELGIALVVAAVFTAGSFLIQLWTAQIEVEHSLYSQLSDARQREMLETYAKEMNAIAARIAALDPQYEL
ncbi:hypothetical protein [Kineosporia babensis]|uniref:Uncharacterized protein n=1 Tax=Kineosporia babensis TaxID=499548 RepID=A0A9X1NE50_9ACTN|nr:hypothetical protein [Kineosporia babensis]MCD5313312.1 hypothetical protein [Kineosporia babensis]